MANRFGEIYVSSKGTLNKAEDTVWNLNTHRGKPVLSALLMISLQDSMLKCTQKIVCTVAARNALF